MKIRFALTLLFLLLLISSSIRAQQKPSDYATQLAALKSGGTITDYARLRLSWVDSPEYKKEKDKSKEEKEMTAALNAKDFPRALKNATAVLDSEYVNMDAHFVAYIANREMANSAEADFHHAVFRGLLDSIHNSGDGLSMEKAWVVIAVHEEYVMLRALGCRPGEQGVMNKDGHSYDEMKVKCEDGDHTYYFNVDIPFKHYGF